MCQYRYFDSCRYQHASFHQTSHKSASLLAITNISVHDQQFNYHLSFLKKALNITLKLNLVSWMKKFKFFLNRYSKSTKK